MSKTVFFDIDSREYQGRWFTNKRYIFGRRCLAFPAVFFCPSYFSLPHTYGETEGKGGKCYEKQTQEKNSVSKIYGAR